jgi:hypothetical protein
MAFINPKVLIIPKSVTLGSPLVITYKRYEANRIRCFVYMCLPRACERHQVSGVTEKRKRNKTLVQIFLWILL